MRLLLVPCLFIAMAANAFAQLETQSNPGAPFRTQLQLNEDPANPGALANSGNTNRNTGRTVNSYGNVHVAAYVSEEGGGVSTATEIYFNVSRDNGRTWSLPVQVSPTDGFATDQPKVFVGPDPLNPGDLIFNVVCEDGRKGMGDFPDDVRSFWSTDGVVWSEANYLSGQPGVNPQAGICGDCVNGLEFDVDEMRASWSDNGILHITGEEQGRQVGCPGDGNESIWYARSTDGGRTIEAPRYLDNYVLGASCQLSDVDSPAIASERNVVVIAWSDNSESQAMVPGAASDDLWAAVSLDGGMTFSVQIPETNNMGGEAGDTDQVKIDIDFYDAGQGEETRIGLLYIDNEAAGGSADSVTLLTSNTGGVTWSAEKDVDPSITGTGNSGAEYLNLTLAGETIVTGYCADYNAMSINMSAPSFGNNDDFREAFINVSFDFGQNFFGAVDLDVPAGGAPNRANNELFVLTDGETIITQYQVNPFGGNDDAWNWSADIGFSFTGTQILFESFLGDVDRGNTGDKWLTGNFDDLSFTSILGINGTGQNEDYVIGLKFPYLTSDFTANPGAMPAVERFGVAGAIGSNAGDSFLVGVSTSGNYPTTNLGGGFQFPLVIDATTLLIATDPTLVLFTSGLLAGGPIGEGQALPFPALTGATLNLAGIHIDSTGAIAGTTDAYTISY